MATEPLHNALSMSQLLDLHLSRSIERLKKPRNEPVALNKIQELARQVRATRANFDEQATELATEHEELRRAGEEQFARYREHHKQVREDLDALREMLSDETGSNSKNAEGSGDSSETFQGKTDGGA